ncbi:hypothetical protein LLEC1_06440 [Akanthomyces lecanii]|uniref:U6 snRNA phosphodiesterase n=1 Tax=Cordyceps confragosa TaxID=2714763 RepID=A0A179IE30_CORDF|nr:hypothetical protein LLEC1_06440 [Akanthomyces lecanii]
MPLVNYSSSSDSEDGIGAHSRSAAKHQTKRSTSGDSAGNSGAQGAQQPSSMPPLPSEFHDLYAATVRQSTVDDPSLHQGRKRQVPHILGQWPSHVYIEWRPSHKQHAALTRLLDRVEETLDGEIELHQFMTSDLGAPLPLHVSLSRPLSLPTADKDDFLRHMSASLGSGTVRPFAVRPRCLAWFTSPDSNRSFLVLGVATVDDEQDNGALMELLRKSNAAAAQFGQPLLYQTRDDDTARTAFHVKIGNAVTSIALSRHAPGQERTRFLFDET